MPLNGNFFLVREAASMHCKAFLTLALLGMATFSFSQAKEESAGKPALTETQKQGQLIFHQRCSLCHTPPTITSPLYGPRLSKQVIIGREDLVEKQILDGTAKMPGFRYGLERSEIAAVMDYLKTMEPAPSNSTGQTTK
jgi:mono/diheme cytochrome c family protein